MAKAIVRIKSGTAASPGPYNAANGTGLTYGELGARIQNNFNSLYIGSDNQPIMIGAEVSDDVTLSSNSQYKIPTQGAVKTYVDNIISSNNLTPPFFLSRYSNELVYNVTVPFSFNGVQTVRWENPDIITQQSPLEYISNDGFFPTPGFLISTEYRGAFRNSSSNAIRVNVIYQIMWSQTAGSIPEEDSKLQKNQWIETYNKFSQVDRTITGTYGFSSLVITRVLNNTSSVYDGIANASAIFTLNPNERFVVKAWNIGGSATKILASNDLVTSKATRIQIVGI